MKHENGRPNFLGVLNAGKSYLFALKFYFKDLLSTITLHDMISNVYMCSKIYNVNNFTWCYLYDIHSV